MFGVYYVSNKITFGGWNLWKIKKYPLIYLQSIKLFHQLLSFLIFKTNLEIKLMN